MCPFLLARSRSHKVKETPHLPAVNSDPTHWSLSTLWLHLLCELISSTEGQDINLSNIFFLGTKFLSNKELTYTSLLVVYTL